MVGTIPQIQEIYQAAEISYEQNSEDYIEDRLIRGAIALDNWVTEQVTKNLTRRHAQEGKPSPTDEEVQSELDRVLEAVEKYGFNALFERRIFDTNDKSN